MLLFNLWPFFLALAANCPVGLLNGPSLWFSENLARRARQGCYVANMGADTEDVKNQICHSRARSDIGGNSGSLRALDQSAFQGISCLCAEFCRTPRSFGFCCLIAILEIGRFPSSKDSTVHADNASHCDRWFAPVFEQGNDTRTASFEFLLVPPGCHRGIFCQEYSTLLFRSH